MGNGKLFPLVDPKNWADIYKIRLDPILCSECKNMVEFNKPFAIEGYRGLIAIHNCDNQIFRCVPIGEKIEFWERFRP